MSPPKFHTRLLVMGMLVFILGALTISRSASVKAKGENNNPVVQNAVNKVEQGEQIFRLDTCMNLGLTDGEKSDLVQYLLSLKF